MPGTVVVGAQWGDEGKGRVVDLLSAEADLVCRYQGGNNAGHTVLVGDTQFAFHLIPTGILRGVPSVMGSGMVVDLHALTEERCDLESKGVQVEGKLSISENAHLILPYHKLLEQAQEEALGDRKIGTTLRGIGPAYVDKFGRCGIRIGDLLEPDTFRSKLEQNVEHKNRLLQAVYGRPGVDGPQLDADTMRLFAPFAHMVTDSSLRVHRALAAGERVLFEGAHGTLLDIDFGTYPFVTSSNPLAGEVCSGIGIGPKWIQRIVGVIKPYTTRVGAGPFPTEVDESIASRIRQVGREFGTTTGRPRRIGWFDAMVVAKAARLNGLDEVAVTHLDALDEFETIPICTGYRCDGRAAEAFPNSLQALARCEPVCEEVPGWRSPTRSITEWAKLPDNARRYIERIEALLGLPVSIILVGPRRAETIIR